MSAPTIEEWREILGYEGLYEAFNIGRVRRIFPLQYAGIRKPFVTHEGYHMLSLSKKGHRHRFQIGEIVCLAFIGPRPSPTHQCAHGDGDNSHNWPGNLRWATPKENCADRAMHGRTCMGVDHPRATLTEADVRRICNIYQPRLGQKIADEYGITRRQVSSIVRRVSWKHLTEKEEKNV